MSGLQLDASGGLRAALASRKGTWWVPRDPVIEQVLVPALESATGFECMAGYFGGGVLRDLAPGLASFIMRTSAPIRLLVSPVIGETDQEALRQGLKDPRELAADALAAAFCDETALASALARHTQSCLAHLVRQGRLDLRVVLMKDGIFHPKQWTFIDGEDIAVLSGSANFTHRAVSTNVEKFHMQATWKGETEECLDAIDVFNAYWENRYEEHAVSVTLDRAVTERLLKPYDDGSAPDPSAYYRARELEGLPPVSNLVTSPAPFAIPPGVSWEDGPYRHQGAAVHAWENNGRAGVLCMATGAGKTITSLIAAQRLWEEQGSLLVIAVAPTLPLVSQWTEEMRDFGLRPYNSLKGTGNDHVARIAEQLEYLEFGASTVESVVVTHDLIKRADLRALLEKHRSRVLLIADEMHNLGTDRFISEPPDLTYKLGLSATPERQYDEEGTVALLAYFGGVVFEFGLDQAIGLCLVPYNYFLHPVRLTDDENDEYVELSAKIAQSYARSGGESTAAMQRLLEQRRLVLESASGKIHELERLLIEGGLRELRYTLIYCTDKKGEQLKAVNQLLRTLGVRYHQVTAEETQQPALLERTIAGFRSGSIQVLTAMRVLDEGFNLPEISTAYILASTTVRRQWVQRRGRVLRLCKTIDKPFANIFDLVVLPPESSGGDADARRLVKAELERCDEFAALALNRNRQNGPAGLIQDLETEYVVWAVK
jgi:superfamily II DNA or RNA helicase